MVVDFVDPTWRPDRDEYLVSIAQVVSTRATCTRLKVGALLVRDGRLLSTGYNGAPTGQPHCSHGDPDVVTSRHCLVSMHAEANAVVFAARHGVATEGAHLVCTHAPCLGCSGLLINAGIRSVLYAWDYGDRNGVDRLAAAGIEIRQWNRSA